MAIWADNDLLSTARLNAQDITSLILGGTLAVTGNAGFYGVAPVAQAADMGAFTSFGASANHALVDVTTLTVADPAKINANFDDVADGLNDIRTVLRNLGLMA